MSEAQRGLGVSFGRCQPWLAGLAAAALVLGGLTFGPQSAAATSRTTGSLAKPATGCAKTAHANGSGYRPPRSGSRSLPTETPRPGPNILYRRLAKTSQLENTGIWKAQPILVSGASAYRKGEFLYQDFLYDDHGAALAGNPDPSYLGFGARGAGWGSYIYPNDTAYAGNAADIVELRLKPTARATTVRITYNAMTDPALVATTIALGNSRDPREMPHGANAQMPAKTFVTVHGCDAEVVDAATGNLLNLRTRLSLDRRRRQVEVRIPYSAFDPRGQKRVRIAAATGLWDTAGEKFLLPQEAPDPNTPGGSGGVQNPAAFFNVAFRYDEPIRVQVPAMDSPGNLPPVNTWMEYQQAHALRTGDLSEFFATVNFVKLARRATDNMRGRDRGIPRRGYFHRIHVSHFAAGQGRSFNSNSPTLDNTSAGVPCNPPQCVPELAGPLQPYSIYVPPGPKPRSGWGLTVELHGCGHNYNYGAGFRDRTDVAERGPGSISIAIGGRGQCYWWLGQAGAEVFEVWADTAARYPLDPSYAAIEGGSMGGYGTYKLAGQWPDLFARAAPFIPCPSAGTYWAAPGTPAPGGDWTVIQSLLPSFRNLPLFVAAGAADPICAYWRQAEDIGVLDGLGYRYKFWSLSDGHGLPLWIHYRNGAATAEWMGGHRVDRNPARVTYALVDRLNEPSYGLNADHSYWLSGMTLRDRGGDSPRGEIDVRSHGFGVEDPPANPTEYYAGMMQGGEQLPAIPYIGQDQGWGAPPAAPVENRLDIQAVNIRAVTINVDRARVGCDAELDVSSDGPLTVTLEGAGCDRRVTFT
jgi:hypothetical protein